MRFRVTITSIPKQSTKTLYNGPDPKEAEIVYAEREPKEGESVEIFKVLTAKKEHDWEIPPKYCDTHKPPCRRCVRCGWVESDGWDTPCGGEVSLGLKKVSPAK